MVKKAPVVFKHNVLVVVDMQPCFEATRNSWMINSVSERLREARNRADHIIFLEYTDLEKGDRRTWEPTHPELLQIVQKPYYCYWDILIKDEDDGSSWIKAHLDRIKVKPISFNVCGVNLDYCVFDTVRGLANLYKTTPINVLKGSINGEGHQPKNWSKFNTIKTANIIG